MEELRSKAGFWIRPLQRREGDRRDRAASLSLSIFARVCVYHVRKRERDAGGAWCTVYPKYGKGSYGGVGLARPTADSEEWGGRRGQCSQSGYRLSGEDFLGPRLRRGGSIAIASECS